MLIILDGLQPKVVSLSEVSENDLWIHDEQDATKAHMLSTMFDDALTTGNPRPFGVLYATKKPTYNELFSQQHEKTKDLESIYFDENLDFLRTSPQPKKENLSKYYESQDYISHTDEKRGLIASLYQIVKKWSLNKKANLMIGFLVLIIQ